MPDQQQGLLLKYASEVEKLGGVVEGLRALVEHRMRVSDDAIRELTDKIQALTVEMARREQQSQSIVELTRRLTEIEHSQVLQRGYQMGYGAAGGSVVTVIIALVAKLIGS